MFLTKYILGRSDFVLFSQTLVFVTILRVFSETVELIKIIIEQNHVLF